MKCPRCKRKVQLNHRCKFPCPKCRSVQTIKSNNGIVCKKCGYENSQDKCPQFLTFE